MLLAAPAGGIDPAKRLARLREVREQERLIAAVTRANFQTAFKERERELSRPCPLPANPASAPLAEALHHAAAHTGAAHGAARAERDVQRVEAAENAAAWHDGLERKERREAGALHDMHAEAAVVDAVRTALVGRRDRVARTEASRSLAAVVHARSVDAHRAALGLHEAMAAAERAAGPHAVISRNQTRIDFASTRLHGAAELAARTPGLVGGQVTVQRHAGVVPSGDGADLAYAAGPSSTELAREDGERRELLRQRQRKERAEAGRLCAVRGQNALAKVKLDEAHETMQRELDSLDFSQKAHKISQLAAPLRAPQPLWSAPFARAPTAPEAAGSFAPAVPREATSAYKAQQQRAETALSDALRAPPAAAQDPALYFGAAAEHADSPWDAAHDNMWPGLTRTWASAADRGRDVATRDGDASASNAGTKPGGATPPASKPAAAAWTQRRDPGSEARVAYLRNQHLVAAELARVDPGPLGLGGEISESEARRREQVQRQLMAAAEELAIECQEAPPRMPTPQCAAAAASHASASRPPASEIDALHPSWLDDEWLSAGATALPVGEPSHGGGLPPTAAAAKVAAMGVEMEGEARAGVRAGAATVAPPTAEAGGDAAPTPAEPVDRHAAFVARFEALRPPPPPPPVAEPAAAEGPLPGTTKMRNLLPAGSATSAEGGAGASQPLVALHGGAARPPEPEEEALAWLVDEPPARPRSPPPPQRPKAAATAPARRSAPPPPAAATSRPASARQPATAATTSSAAKPSNPPSSRFSAKLAPPKPPAARQPRPATQPPAQQRAPQRRPGMPAQRALDEPRPKSPPPAQYRQEGSEEEPELRPWPTMPGDAPEPPRRDSSLTTWPQTAPASQPRTAGPTRAQLAAARAAATRPLPASPASQRACSSARPLSQRTAPRVAAATRRSPAARAESATPAAAAHAEEGEEERRARVSEGRMGRVWSEEETERLESMAEGRGGRRSGAAWGEDLFSAESRGATAGSSQALFSQSDGFGSSSSSSCSLSPLLHRAATTTKARNGASLPERRCPQALSASSSSLSLLSDPRLSDPSDARAPRAYAAADYNADDYAVTDSADDSPYASGLDDFGGVSGAGGYGRGGIVSRGGVAGSLSHGSSSDDGEFDTAGGGSNPALVAGSSGAGLDLSSGSSSLGLGDETSDPSQSDHSHAAGRSVSASPPAPSHYAAQYPSSYPSGHAAISGAPASPPPYAPAAAEALPGFSEEPQSIYSDMLADMAWLAPGRPLPSAALPPPATRRSDPHRTHTAGGASRPHSYDTTGGAGPSYQASSDPDGIHTAVGASRDTTGGAGPSYQPASSTAWFGASSEEEDRARHSYDTTGGAGPSYQPASSTAWEPSSEEEDRARSWLPEPSSEEEEQVMMICLPPQGTPPHTQQPTWPTTHTAHSQHCGHTALPPGQKPNPRRRADPTQTVYACLCVFCVGPLFGHPLRWWVLCGPFPSVWVPLCGSPLWVPRPVAPRSMWHLLA